MTKVTTRQCAHALRKAGGIVGKAARELGIERSSLTQRIARNPVLQKAKAEGEEYVSDTAEGNVTKAIDDGDVSTSRWWLAQKAKSRGYGVVRVDDDQLAMVVGKMTPADLKKLAEEG